MGPATHAVRPRHGLRMLTSTIVLAAACLTACGNDWKAEDVAASLKYIKTSLVPAIQAYCREHGEVPHRLCELVPKYLSRVEPPRAGHEAWSYRTWSAPADLLVVDPERHRELVKAAGGSQLYIELLFGVGEWFYPCEGVGVFFNTSGEVVSQSIIVNY